MSRSLALSLLRNYQPYEDADRQAMLRTAHFIEANPECFHRTLKKGHVTGAAWILNGTHEKILLCHHRKLNQWLQLGGHADGESDVLQVAHREAIEESGIDSVQPLSSELFDVDVHFIPPRKNEPAHFHYDFRFLFHSPHTEAVKVSNESIALEWFSFDHPKFATVDASVQRMLRKTKPFLEAKMLRKNGSFSTQPKL